jgi:hypothetical protein
MNDRLFEGEEPIVHLMGSEGQGAGSGTGEAKIVVAEDFD